MNRVLGWVAPKYLCDSLLIADLLARGAGREIRRDQSVHDRGVFELELGQLRSQVTLGRFEPRP